MNTFVFRPYTAIPEGFKPVMFYTNVVYGDDPSMTLIPLSENLDFPSLTEKLLALLASLVPSLGKNGKERSAIYAHLRVRRQFGFDQGVPQAFLAEDSGSVKRLFWSFVFLPLKSLHLFHYIANMTRMGGISKAYMTYSMKCFATIARFRNDKLLAATLGFCGSPSLKGELRVSFNSQPISKSSCCPLPH